MSNASAHKPVLLDEVLSCLKPADGEVYVDATFGAGGYTRAILDAADCTVIALDRDVSAKQFAESLRAEYGDRLIFRKASFANLESVLREIDVKGVDGIVLDIGVSSMQLDQADRGFSFRQEGPLDMRMDQESGQSAAEFLAEIEERELARTIWEYGEERHSRKIAREICRVRQDKDIRTTSELADIVRSCVPGRGKPGIDKATRTFQALRIAVNDELGELRAVLQASRNVLNAGGRLLVVSFHSLEDRIVKRFMKAQTQARDAVSRHMPVNDEAEEPDYVALTGKPLSPTQEEISANPRARSARLRAIRKMAAESIDGTNRGEV